MSKDESTEDPRTVSLEDPAEGTAELATAPDAEPEPEPELALLDVHVITLRGADGWVLSHPESCSGCVQCADETDCPVSEAAGRISQAMCATLGRWSCEVAGGSLMLAERLGD